MTKPDPTNFGQSAMKYAERDVLIFPLKPRDKTPLIPKMGWGARLQGCHHRR